MLIFFFLRSSILVWLVQCLWSSVPPLARPRLPPQGPHRVVFAQEIARHDSVTCSILNVDMEVMTAHEHYEVKIELKLMGNAPFNAKVICLMPRPPGFQFGNRKQDR